MNYNLPFKIYANCFIVRGHSRSTICDLDREKYYLVPNAMLDILRLYERNSVGFILDQFDDDDRNTVKEYFTFLVQNELIFFIDNDKYDLFPSLNTQYFFPGDISNAVIDLDRYEPKIIDTISLQLENLGCYAISIRCFFNVSITVLSSLAEYYNGMDIKQIELHITLENNDDLPLLKDIVAKNGRIKSIYVYNLKNEIIRTGVNNFGNIISTIDALKTNSCGIVSPEYFTTNYQHFFESLEYNSCLNKKITIDSNGNIKNCPAMAENFGNIKNISIRDVLENPNFRKMWLIKKDNITTCKDCEFRHICTDCRAFIETPSDSLSKPLKCGYNPYDTKWNNWKLDSIKADVIRYYSL